MDIRSPRSVKLGALESLSGARCNPRQLALCYTAVALALSALLTLANYCIDQGIGSTGGLSGMGTRTLLLTVQSVLSFLGMFLLPFWQIGFVHTGLAMARRQVADPSTLAEGFRRFWPVLRLQLLKLALLMIAMMLCTQVSSIVLSIVALPRSMIEAMESMPLDSTGELILDEAMLEAAMPSDALVILVFGALMAAVVIFLFYKFRLAEYVLMEDAPKGALAALGRSHRLTKGNRMALLRLDLSLWWYYGLHVLAALVCFGDQLLALVGVDLGISSDALFFLCYGVYIVIELILAWFAGSYVQTTYSCAYNVLKQEFEADPTPKRRRFPWDMLPY